MSLIYAREVDKTYSTGVVKLRALRKVSFKIDENAFVAFAGPSGSGKTTSLNLIGCLDKPTSGGLLVAATDRARLNGRRAAVFRGENIGFIFQNSNLLPVLTAYENIEYPLVMVQNVPAGERRERVLELLDAVGLADQEDKYPGQISGGQMQRAAIARALVTRPQLVLAGEPTAHPDHDTAIRIIRLMKDIRTRLDATFIFSTHGTRIIGEVEIIYTLEDGRLLGREAAHA